MIGVVPAGVMRTPPLGFRVWRVGLFGGLRSWADSSVWASEGWHVARCGLGLPHRAAEPGCSCGIHATGDVATARRYARHEWRWRPRLRDRYVIGAVQLGGRVVVRRVRPDRHGRGGLQFRAELARVVALADFGPARRVGRQLGLPIVRLDYLESVARELWGVQLRALPPATPARAWPRPLTRALDAVEAAVAWPPVRLPLRVAWFGAWWAARLCWLACWLPLKWGALLLAGLFLAHATGAGRPARRRFS